MVVTFCEVGKLWPLERCFLRRNPVVRSHLSLWLVSPPLPISLYLSSSLSLDFLMIFIECVSQGVTDVLCEACESMKWTTPTPIQMEALPVSLQGRHHHFVMTCYVYSWNRSPFSVVQVRTSLVWLKQAQERQVHLLYPFSKHCWKHHQDYLLLFLRLPGTCVFYKVDNVDSVL